ncbi:hypothetical protein [Azospirillum thermophilum]|uniref:Uncharacterized protein n=1 Tax=Azospirillum thermophilum TaxID=2202148 RepID=A0A2S2CKZ5_9PROT|nr:hypothetical protein [Azospirillum thermophilum]AWK85164.1 hypothetical protein DEW08_02295 [Azospirillum thermophilum]
MIASIAALVDEYNEWARDEGVNQMTRSLIEGMLEERGIKVGKAKWNTNNDGFYLGTGKVCAIGIGLKSDTATRVAAHHFGLKIDEDDTEEEERPAKVVNFPGRRKF